MGVKQNRLTIPPAYTLAFNNHVLLHISINKPSPAQRYSPCILHKDAIPISMPTISHCFNDEVFSSDNNITMVYIAAVQNNICGESGNINNPAITPV